MLTVFIILDLIWSVSAWVYDSGKLAEIPVYFWPFIAICPIYPLLLALVLLQLYLKRLPNQFLLAFAVIPSIVFGILALLYYPIAMIYQGFSWNALGQIFWVLFYAIQGVWLFYRYKIDRLAFIITSLFLIIALVFQFMTESYGYFDFSKIPQFVLVSLIGLAILILIYLREIIK